MLSTFLPRRSVFLPLLVLTLATLTSAVSASTQSVGESANQATDSALQESLLQNSAVQAIFQRLSGDSKPPLQWTLQSDNQPHWVETRIEHGVIKVRGNAATALAYGAYQLLRSQGYLSVSWEGNRLALPARLPDVAVTRLDSLFTDRAYLNVCAYGYSSPWWDWPRWQQEIDWMALHGVTQPVAMEGQEFIWQQLWREFGLGDNELTQYFSGPAFLPWQRMGNIEAHAGPLPQSYIEKKRQLQRQILTQMQALQMQPVVPAFSGYVPDGLKQLFPQARIKKMKAWSGFARETYWLDPADPLFSKIAKRFIELYQAEYGLQRYFLLDAFNEMLPPVSAANKNAELANYGAALYQTLAQASPGAIWVMQGWMFGSDAHFWDLPAIEAFLSKVPANNMLIHDIGNDRFDVWQKAKGFYGKPWVFGFIHNYGGSNPVYGDFDFYRHKTNIALNHADKGQLRGFGAFPEGIHSNSLVYDFMFDLAWQAKSATANHSASTTDWLAQQLQARYGELDPAVSAQWLNIYKAVYSTRYWEPRWWEDAAGGALLQKRPKLDYLRYTGAPGNLMLLDQALRDLTQLPASALKAPLLQFDLVDLQRHSATQHIDMLLQHTMLAYSQGQLAQGDKLRAQAKALILSVDALMGYQAPGTKRETLYSWVADARAYGDTAAEKTLYEHNAKLQVTRWGGDKLKDYASKAWFGLYAQYYLPRWELFFTAQRDALVAKIPFDAKATEAKLIAFDDVWLQQPLAAPQQAPADFTAALAAIQQQILASKAPPSNL